MAKSSKSSRSTRTERQKVVEQMRAQQKAAERRRGGVIVAVCVLVAFGIIVAAAWGPVMDHFQKQKYDGKALEEIGAAAGVCQEPTTKPASGNQQHLPDGSPVDYPDNPPAFGEHYIDPDPMARKFYTDSDRPALGTLVHNEEHGYTILWYDDSIADDPGKLNEIDGIADKFRADNDNFRLKFIAAPWTSADEKESGKFPSGMHVAMSHWSAGGSGQTDASKQVGVFQYCSEPSGAALKSFMLKYPYTDAPEPDAM